MCGATSCLLVWSSSCLWLTTVLWCHNHWSTEELPGTELLKIFMLFSTSAHNPEEVGNSGQGRHNDFRLTAAFTQSFYLGSGYLLWIERYFPVLLWKDGCIHIPHFYLYKDHADACIYQVSCIRLFKLVYFAAWFVLVVLWAALQHSLCVWDFLRLWPSDAGVLLYSISQIWI